MDNLSTAQNGVIAVMRQLNALDGMPLSALDGGHDHNLQRLKILREVYGAVSETPAGWRLNYAPEWLTALKLPLPFTVMDEAASTHQAVQSCPPPYALLAEHQYAGIGQRRRRWLALPADAIILSLCLKPPSQVTGLSVALGIRLCSALARFQPLRFKWPNDIMTLSGGKAAGILTQLRNQRLMVSVGCNWRLTSVFERTVADYGGRAGALANEQTADHSRRRCVKRIVETVLKTVAEYDRGFAAFREQAVAAHIVAVGQTFTLSGGAQLQFAGFDVDGALLAADNGVVRRYLEGRVEHVAGG